MAKQTVKPWLPVAAALAFWSALPAPAAAQPLSFVARRDFAVGPNPCSPTVGDYNDDDVPDLAVAIGSSAATSGSSGAISVLLGNGDGTFQARLGDTFYGGCSGMAKGDYNGDGTPDLAATNFNANTVSVWLANYHSTVSVLLDNGVGPSKRLRVFPWGAVPTPWPWATSTAMASSI